MTRTSRGRRSRRNGRETRLRVLQIATRKFSESGYAATSLRQIANGAEIDLATLKYHFGDKPALYAEVYQAGHLRFLEAVGPVLSDMIDIETREEAVESIDRLAEKATVFVLDEQEFVRMFMYRLLESTDEIIGLEQELQVSAVGMVQRTFERLSEAGVLRETNASMLTMALLTGLPMTLTATLSRPDWIAHPATSTSEGRAAVQAALRDALERLLLP